MQRPYCQTYSAHTVKHTAPILSNIQRPYCQTCSAHTVKHTAPIQVPYRSHTAPRLFLIILIILIILTIREQFQKDFAIDSVTVTVADGLLVHISEYNHFIEAQLIFEHMMMIPMLLRTAKQKARL